jgi:hypothetical protein
MPHPSIPLDDFRAHSFNREHGPRSRVSRTFGLLSIRARKSCLEEDRRVERLSDGILFSLLFVHTAFVLLPTEFDLVLRLLSNSRVILSDGFYIQWNIVELVDFLLRWVKLCFRA